MKKYLEINKILEENNFKLYYKESPQSDDTQVYIYTGDENGIVLTEQNRERYEDRYYIILALMYYLNSINKSNFFMKISRLNNDDIVNKTIDLLLPEEKFKKIVKRKKGNVLKISEYFKVPKFIVEQKMNRNISKEKIKIKSKI